jgi:cytochrome c-type protein NapB
MTMKSVVILSLTVALGVGIASMTWTPVGAQAPSPVPDSRLGLAKGSVLDVLTPPTVKPNETAPGELPVLPRAYAIAPPRIPHGIGDFLPLTAKQNACVDCHEVKEKKTGEPTPMPVSHYTDYRNAPGTVRPTVVGARQMCVACHVSGTDAPDLIENRFNR